jgi:hypothetical protein
MCDAQRPTVTYAPYSKFFQKKLITFNEICMLRHDDDEEEEELG